MMGCVMSESIKLLLIQITASIAVLLVNAVIAYSFYQLVVMTNLTDMMNLNFKITDFFFLLFSLYLMRINIAIPFHNYKATTLEEFQAEMHSELSGITDHIITSAIFTTLLIFAMNYIRL